MGNKLIQVKGRHLIEGKKYFIGKSEEYKAIYEGVITSNNGEERHLFTPTGQTPFMLYDEKDYGGKYIGKFSIWDHGHFFEAIE